MRTSRHLWRASSGAGCSPFHIQPSTRSTIPETNKSHSKMDGWNTSFLLGWPIFRGYVSFREGNLHFLLQIITCMFHPGAFSLLVCHDLESSRTNWFLLVTSLTSTSKMQKTNQLLMHASLTGKSHPETTVKTSGKWKLTSGKWKLTRDVSRHPGIRLWKPGEGF